jgi:hypothetical protein
MYGDSPHIFVNPSGAAALLQKRGMRLIYHERLSCFLVDENDRHVPSRSCLGHALLSGRALSAPQCTVVNQSTITFVGAPSLRTIGAGTMIEITYVSHAQGCDYLGILFLVAHNSISQTVYIATATILLPPNLNVTVYPLVFGFPSGTFLNSTIFVVSPSGVALSSSTTLIFTIL